jgi:glycosyltransferase involved in cell wall biosynthesis/GT2 family glycosyltransferase
MRIALGIVKLFPEGGLQRDCIRLARILVARGHEVTLFASENKWPFEQPPCRIVLLPVRAYTNHRLDLNFTKRFAAATADGFDRVVGFNKLTGLDFYYCGDPSILERGRNLLERSLPRHRVQAMLEQESFGPLQRTQILALTKASAASYRRNWLTQEQRITVLQPSIDPTRQRPDLRSADHRAAVRAKLGLADDRWTWLWVGAQAHVKGLDRALAALQSAPDNATLLVAGVAPDSKDAAQATRVLARRPGSVRFLGFRDDIPELMAAADVLVHPSRLDVTGQVILEAIVNGLPCVVTGLCGFAEHVEKSGAGIVLPEPFSQNELDAALARMRDPALAETMSLAGIRYGHDTAPVSGLDQAADVIEGRPADQPIAASSAPAAARRMTVPRYVPISIIVTTYNRPDALDAVLRGLARQSDKDFEVIVADDGSAPDTTAMLKSWQSSLPQPLTHIWQEHRGFRAAEIRNRAILASSGAYCIFLDGDCIPRHDFVLEHRELAEPGWLVVGNRVLMSKRLTDSVLRQSLEPELWTFADACRARFHGDINRIAPLLQARLGPVRKIRPQYWWGARSCNLAIWRADLDRVDGFDGNYVGWGLEDSDLLIRLLRAGVNRKDGRFSTGVLHLWHPLADPSLLSANQILLEAIQHSNRVLSVSGLSSLQGAAESRRTWNDDRRSESQIAIA